MRIEYHRTLTADRVRNDAFYAALKKVIVPGKTVVADIGAGTGILGMMASKLGAKEVFLYEMNDVGGVAAELLKRNRIKNCLLLPCHSTAMERPPRVDVVVSETLGNYPLEEDIISIMRDAKKRHLKPGGTIIPRRVAQYVGLVTTPRIHDELTTWGQVGFDIDFGPAQFMTMNNIYVRVLSPSDLLDDGRSAVRWDAFDLMEGPTGTRKGEASFKPKAPTTIHGLALWWTAELVDGVTLSTAPDAPRTHWEQLYLPLLEPMAVKTGERITVSLRSRTNLEHGTTLAWSATHHDAKGATIAKQSLDLEKGYLP